MLDKGHLQVGGRESLIPLPRSISSGKRLAVKCFSFIFMWKSQTCFSNAALKLMGMTTPTFFAGKSAFTASTAGAKSLSPDIMSAVSKSSLTADLMSSTAMFTSVFFFFKCVVVLMAVSTASFDFLKLPQNDFDPLELEGAYKHLMPVNFLNVPISQCGEV